MTDYDAKWRVDLAHQIAARYPAEAVLLVGSAASGYADARSDLDLLMYWQTFPNEVQRHQIATEIGGQRITLSDSSDDDRAARGYAFCA